MKPVDGSGGWVEEKSVRTFINPAKKQGGTGDVNIIPNDIRIYLTNCDAQYYYGVTTTADGVPTS